MKIALVCVSSKRPAWLVALEQAMQSRLAGFCDFSIHHVPPSKRDRSQAEQKKKEENESLLKFIQERDFVIAYDERGKLEDSLQFAKRLQSAFQSGSARYVFVIGGAYGLDEAVKKRAQAVLSLSPLTMSHLIAESVALEQLYRGFCILHNRPYHNDDSV